jgi:AraC-like DNA-binding protein
MSESVKFVLNPVRIKKTIPEIPNLHIVRCGFGILEDWQTPLRSVSHWHLYWNRTPGAELLLPMPERAVEMLPCNVYLIPPHTVFGSVMSADSVEHCYLDFHLTGENFNSLRREILSFPVQDFSGLLNRCFSNPISILDGGALVFSLLARIEDSCFLPHTQHAIDPRIQKALEIIAELLESGTFECLNNTFLSRAVNTSLDNFQHLFQREMKISPGRYLLNQRLSKAWNLLKSTEKPIEQIAAETGFANRYQFTNAFSALFDISPARFRRQYASDKIGSR